MTGLASLTGAPCESISLQAQPSTNGGSSGEETEGFDEDLIWARLLSSRTAGKYGCALIVLQCPMKINLLP